MGIEFKENGAIYLQIVDYASERILLKIWREDERIPAVRELAVQLEVNQNTILKAYEYLQNAQIIYNKRGLGYFVAAGAYTNIINHKKTVFIQQNLPELFKMMHLLKIDLQTIEKEYQRFSNNQEITQDEKK